MALAESKIEALFSGVSATLKSVREVQKIYDPMLAFGFNSLNFFRPGENKTSEILAYFLNPKQKHGQGNSFLKKFLEIIDFDTEKISELINKDVKIECEHIIPNNRRIDIFISFEDSYCLAIENKIWAEDQGNQLTDYDLYLRNKFTDNYCLLYLTPYGKNPTENSISETIISQRKISSNIKIISYASQLINCIKEWSKLCRADRVRSFLIDFEQYLNQEMIGDQFMNEHEFIVDYVLKSNNVESALIISETVPDLKNKLLDRFKYDVIEISNTLNFKFKDNENFGNPEEYLVLENPNWQFFDIFLGFDLNEYKYFSFGLCFKGWNKDLKGELSNEMIDKLNLERERRQGKSDGNIDEDYPFWDGWQEYRTWNTTAFVDIANGTMKDKFQKLLEKEVFKNFKEYNHYL